MTGGLYRLCSLSIALTSSYPPERSHPDGFPYIMWHDSIIHKRVESLFCWIDWRLWNQSTPGDRVNTLWKKRGDRLLCVLYHIRSTSSSMTQLSFWNKKTFASDSSHTRAATQKDRRHLLRKFSDVISRRRKSQVYIFHIYHTHTSRKYTFSIDCWTLLSFIRIYIRICIIQFHSRMIIAKIQVRLLDAL